VGNCGYSVVEIEQAASKDCKVSLGNSGYFYHLHSGGCYNFPIAVFPLIEMD